MLSFFGHGNRFGYEEDKVEHGAIRLHLTTVLCYSCPIKEVQCLASTLMVFSRRDPTWTLGCLGHILHTMMEQW